MPVSAALARHLFQMFDIYYKDNDALIYLFIPYIVYQRLYT